MVPVAHIGQCTLSDRKCNVIFAVTSQPLRCDVIVDEIVKVEIETTTKELFLDDSPEEFVLRALNDKGIFYRSTVFFMLA